MRRPRSRPYFIQYERSLRPGLAPPIAPRRRGPILKGVLTLSGRGVAYEVVRRVFEEDAYADRAFRALAGELDSRDRAFAMQLAYGTVQLVRPLDHAIETLGRRPLRKLDPPVRAALRLGAYQIGYMGSVPVHAAVNESVELVRAAGLERAVAFTNAVLRRLGEGMERLLAGLGDGTPAEAALKHSYPDWIVEAWWREWGCDDALELMRARTRSPRPPSGRERARSWSTRSRRNGSRRVERGRRAVAPSSPAER